jgi:hypothetical protein
MRPLIGDTAADFMSGSAAPLDRFRVGSGAYRGRTRYA